MWWCFLCGHSQESSPDEKCPDCGREKSIAEDLPGSGDGTEFPYWYLGDGIGPRKDRIRRELEALKAHRGSVRRIRQQPQRERKPSRRETTEGTPDPALTFEGLVVGPWNRFALAASKVVSENPGKAYSPLYIYGETGLGKTHLLHAIGNDILGRNPSLKVQIIDGPVFSASELNADGEDILSRFRSMCEGVEVLLIDGVEVITARQEVQMAFSQIVSELLRTGGQVVVTAMRRPGKIQLLDDDLLTLFEGGLVVDLQWPDAGTRLMLLRSWAETDHQLGDELLTRLSALEFVGGIPELRAALQDVIAYSRETGASEITDDELRTLFPQSDHVLL